MSECDTEGDIKILQSTYNCYADRESDVTKVIITVEKDCTLQFIYEHIEDLCVQFLQSPLENSRSQEIEENMNQVLRQAVQKHSLINQVRCAIEVLKKALDGSEQSNGSMNDDNSKNNGSLQTESHVNSMDACSSTSHKLQPKKFYKKQKKNIVLAPVFSNQPTDEASTGSRAGHAKAAMNSKTLSAGSIKKSPMKTASDVIKRIKWDESLDRNRFTVAYEDRFTGIEEKPFSEFDWENDIASVGPEVLSIPQHRIQYFKYHDRVVWNKLVRLDDIFGSTGGITITEVMQQEKELQNMTREDVGSQLDQEGSISEPSSTPDQSEVVSASGTSQADSRTKQRQKRPNYFVGVRIDNPEIIKSVAEYQKQLGRILPNENDKEAFNRSLTPLEKMHITLCVCHLENEEDIEKAKQVIQQTYIDGNAFQISFHGVSNFNQAVIYAQPRPGTLFKINRRLMDGLRKQGINVDGNYEKYTPHMTLLQFSKCRANLYPKIANFLNGKRSKKQQFGKKTQNLEKILLCKIGRTAPDGFYETVASYPIEMRANSNETTLDQEPNKKKKVKAQKHVDVTTIDGETSNSHQHKVDVRIGKSLAAVLRHNNYGFKVDSEGYVNTGDILKHQHFRKMSVTKEDVYRVVSNNDKRRFTLDTDEHGIERIKANQGHSVEVDDLSLTEITNPGDYPNVVHGTFWPAWKSISKHGLHRRKRIHIHMTTAEPSDDNQVISGMRKSCNVFVYIDIAAAISDGIAFYLSSNGVVLSSGDGNGYLKPKYFLQVFGIRKGLRELLMLHSASDEEAELLDDDNNAAIDEIEAESCVETTCVESKKPVEFADSGNGDMLHDDSSWVESKECRSLSVQKNADSMEAVSQEETDSLELKRVSQEETDSLDLERVSPEETDSMNRVSPCPELPDIAEKSDLGLDLYDDEN